MVETISHYNANGSNVFALMLDASKVSTESTIVSFLEYLCTRAIF